MRTRAALATVLFLLGSHLVAPVAAQSEAEPGAAGLIDEPALEFEATDLEGKTVRLSDLAGQVVLINFWGVWCTNCRHEIPELIALDQQWRDRGLVILGADWGDQPEALPPFVEEFGMTYPVLLDDGLAERYEVIVFPTSFVIDRSGRLRLRVEGFLPEQFEAMTAAVDRLLGDGP
ncbi:MAG: TlpA disulfide reductase family protein [Vicinamibacterales bacterium]|mgnify:FL=1|jgi:peroxiredoxin|nr:alkyl hydroperoxide reductase [Acidobacteriota bacterium]MDP7295463.1 TlpA disulfide reductase family protein [Vicinamibacterales bacterium]MDP7470802.1 TlpA disulfide reductase family protein [Vicinamibacterales bacterium]MDP7672464.1 TlpA disulfide reductase family protein [Vicinamibacterales bacterium]HJO37512.1 TlpA disulfide reductase family protein [Vicinamibacterales bacterium]|tara:strand:+ start:29 stop:556 length:528 start_codon:yes stop_codon:yes gene_type:complete